MTAPVIVLDRARRAGWSAHQIATATGLDVHVVGRLAKGEGRPATAEQQRKLDEFAKRLETRVAV